MSAEDVISAWDQADPDAIHPTRSVSEEAYWASGEAQANLLATVIPAGSKVLDFGCGDGRVAIPMADLGYEVTAADASQRMLDRLAERAPALTTVQAAADGIAAHLGRRRMDAVYSLAVLIHHSYDDCLAIVGKLRAATKLGGILVLDWPVSDRLYRSRQAGSASPPGPPSSRPKPARGSDWSRSIAGCRGASTGL